MIKKWLISDYGLRKPKFIQFVKNSKKKYRRIAKTDSIFCVCVRFAELEVLAVGSGESPRAIIGFYKNRQTRTYVVVLGDIPIPIFLRES